MIIAVPLGYMFSTYLNKHCKWISSLADSNVAYSTLIAAYVLTAVSWMPEEGFSSTPGERIGIQVVYDGAADDSTVSCAVYQLDDIFHVFDDERLFAL